MQRVGLRHGVVSVEAGRAILRMFGVDARFQSFQGKVGERIGANVIADLFDRSRCCDQLSLRVGVDPEKAGPYDGRRGDAQVNFGSSGVA